jgi:pre-mRNA-splicing helicase BRR2
VTLTLFGLQYIRVREEEKLELQKLAERVPIPIKENLDEPSAKVCSTIEVFIAKIAISTLCCTPRRSMCFSKPTFRNCAWTALPLLLTWFTSLNLVHSFERFSLCSVSFCDCFSAGRLLRAIFEICLRRGWAQVAERALCLCKMVDKRMWQSMSPLRQFPKISEKLISTLEKKDFPWERMYDLDHNELGAMIRNPKVCAAA